MSRAGANDALTVGRAVDRTLAHATAHGLYEASIQGSLPSEVPAFDSPVVVEGVVDFANRRTSFDDPPTVADGGLTFWSTPGSTSSYRVIGRRDAAAPVGMPLWLVDVSRGIDSARSRGQETFGEESWSAYDCKSNMALAADRAPGGFAGPRGGLLPARRLAVTVWIDDVGHMRRLQTGWQGHTWTLTLNRFDEPGSVDLPSVPALRRQDQA